MSIRFTSSTGQTWSSPQPLRRLPVIETVAERHGWTLPSLDLLSRSWASDEAEDRSADLLEALALLGATCNVSSVVVAPQAVRYELTPARGVRMRSFHGLEADVMQMLGVTGVRIEAPTPGLTTVGIELPRRDRAIVNLADGVGDASQPLTAAVGVDLNGDVVTLPISSYPHLLIAGRSGGGKSVLLHSILASLLMSHTPDDLQLTLIDTKMVESQMYEGLPHVTAIVHDADRAVRVLGGLVEKMEQTYELMRECGARDLLELNVMLEEQGIAPIPRRLCVIDEASDLMMTAKAKVESSIVRLGQLGRAAGFHVIVATQSPRANVITGMLKANLTARIGLATSNALDSRIILDQNGCESLLGKGDALLDDGIDGSVRRFQTAWAPTQDVEAIVGHWKDQSRQLVAA